MEFKVFKSLKKKSSDIFRIMEYEVIGGEIDTRSIWANNKKYFSTDRVTPTQNGKSVQIERITIDDEGEYICRISIRLVFKIF